MIIVDLARRCVARDRAQHSTGVITVFAPAGYLVAATLRDATHCGRARWFDRPTRSFSVHACHPLATHLARLPAAGPPNEWPLIGENFALIACQNPLDRPPGRT
jgi:hypothetical protein